MGDHGSEQPQSKMAPQGTNPRTSTVGTDRKAEVKRIQSSKALDLKINHFLTVLFFLWLFIIYSIGIYFFTKGFLLTRLVLDHKSECKTLPPGLSIDNAPSQSNGCWHPKKFEKAIVLIIDALRYDFTVPYENSSVYGPPHFYHNSIPIFYDTASKHPANAILLPFIADPPTTTLQRLKGLTTGTLPTFVDAGSNFAGTAIEEDNLIDQLKDNGRRLVHLGDDTWHALFPHHFLPNLTHAYDSFNVWDLHTVDNGVIEHIMPLLSAGNTSQWDILIGHCLGVDHAGHRYGPDHAAMQDKLTQMNGFIRGVMEAVSDDTLLVVMGDHGMDAKGDHGGESDDEVEAALWMYSKKAMFGRSHRDYALPPANAKIRPVGQIDLVPTLALLLGMPIPFNNLGMPIEEAFIGPDGNGWANLATVGRLTSAQIKRYQKEYDKARNLEHEEGDPLDVLWTRAEELWSTKSFKSYSREAYEAYRDFQRETLRICRSLWASFSKPDMLHGIEILALALIFTIVFARGVHGNTTEFKLGCLRRGIIGALVGFIIGASVSLLMSSVPLGHAALYAATTGSILCAISVIYTARKSLVWPLPRSIWGWLSLVFTILQAIGFASNSYTIWEDEILLFFLTTFGVVAGISSLRQQSQQGRVLGTYHSILFVILTRVASLSRLCREEQMPYCKSSFYASSTSSTSAPWQLIIPLMCAMVLPSVIKAFYQGTLSYEGSAVLWVGTVFRMTLLIIASYWTLDAVDSASWYPRQLSYILNSSSIGIVQRTLAQIVFGIAFAVGVVTFVWAKPCVKVSVKGDPSQASPSNTDKASLHTATDEKGIPIVTVLGYANAFGTHYLLLVTAIYLPLTLVLPPMGQLSLSILLTSILSLLEILDTNSLTPSTSPLGQTSSVGPTILALLSAFHFFKTGHTATLASIQWNSAFIPFTTIHYPWSPLLVTMNTFGAQILCAISIPLLVLWKRPVNHGKSARYPDSAAWSHVLLTDISTAYAGFILYFATIGLATTMWAGHLRRHLMVYRVFGPRFMMGAAVLGVVEIVGIFIGIVGSRWTVLAVGGVFGY